VKILAKKKTEIVRKQDKKIRNKKRQKKENNSQVHQFTQREIIIKDH